MPQNFEDLRGEVKAKIFSLLSPLERQVIRPVCTDWKDIIDEEFGIKLVINNGGVETLISTGEYAVEIEMNSLTVPIQTLGMAFPLKLHTLRFHNIAVTYNIFPLLRNFSKTLVTLSFSQLMIDLPERLQAFASVTPEEEHIKLLKLRNLEVNDWNVTESIMALFDFLTSAVTYQSLANISVFLQNPLMIPLHLLFSGDIVGAPNFLQLVKRNLETLESFKYGKPSAVLSLKFYPYGSVKGDQPLQLKEFICFPQFKMDWLSILPSQKKIIRLHIGECRVGMWDGLRNAVRDNAETLETFWIAGQSFNQRWDCDIFRHCSNLRKLCVQLYMSPKVGLTSMPRSVEKINMSGSIKKGEFFNLLLNLENCREAEFSHLGINQALDTAEDRVNLSLILKFIGLPKLSKISFLHCDWNDTDWEEVIQWCANNVTNGIFFEQLFYPLHGQEIRHGIHVHVLPNFDKNSLGSDSVVPQQGYVEGDRMRHYKGENASCTEGAWGCIHSYYIGLTHAKSHCRTFEHP